MTNTEKQELLDNLMRAYYSGQLKIKNGDKEIQFDTGAALLERINQLKKELGQATRKSGRIYLSHSTGLRR